MSKVLPILILSGLLFVSVPSVSYGDETWSPTLGGGMRSSNGTTWSPTLGGGMRSNNGTTCSQTLGGGFRCH